MPTVYIDADACPVKDEALRVAARHGATVYLVADGGVRPTRDPMVKVVVVPEGLDAADNWIAARVGPGDVCVTADIPLAARCIAAGALAVRHDGEVLTERTIGTRLATRDLMADLRSANPLAVGGGPKPFSRADRSRFLDGLERAMLAATRL